MRGIVILTDAKPLMVQSDTGALYLDGFDIHYKIAKPTGEVF